MIKLINLVYKAAKEFEICGARVWVSGNTKPHKNELKQAGFQCAAKKAASLLPKMAQWATNNHERNYY